MTLPENEIPALRRRCNRARNFPTNTCGASRHAEMIADDILAGRLGDLEWDREHIAGSIYATVAALWEARTELKRLRGEDD